MPTETHWNIRRNIIEHLQLLSSKEDQFEYQRTVPIADVSAELFCYWDDQFHKAATNPAWYLEVFTPDEFQALEEFNEVLKEVSKCSPYPLPDIFEFVLTPEWARLSEAASIALKSFQ
jgi:hypothetical protein